MKVSTIISVLAVAGLSLNLPSAMGSGQDRGGEMVFVHKNIFRKQTVYLVESFSLLKTPLYKHLKKVSSDNENEVVALNAAVDFVRSENAQVGAMLARALSELHTDILVSELPLLGNDNIKDEYIPNGTAKEQLAVQDFEAATLTVNQNLFNKLSRIDKLLFRLHEGYLRVLWLANHDPDIQAVRNQVFTWAQDPKFVEFLEVAAPVAPPSPSGCCLIVPTNGWGKVGQVPTDRNTCDRISGTFTFGPC